MQQIQHPSPLSPPFYKMQAADTSAPFHKTQAMRRVVKEVAELHN